MSFREEDAIRCLGEVSLGVSFHIGVGSDVVCSTLIRQLEEPQFVEWTTGRFHAFLCRDF